MFKSNTEWLLFAIFLAVVPAGVGLVAGAIVFGPALLGAVLLLLISPLLLGGYMWRAIKGDRVAQTRLWGWTLVLGLPALAIWGHSVYTLPLWMTALCVLVGLSQILKPAETIRSEAESEKERVLPDAEFLRKLDTGEFR